MVSVDASNKKVLIIGNSYSVDSARYVSLMAKDTGYDINVYLLQHGGSTVRELYENREDARYYTFHVDGVTEQTLISIKNALDMYDFDMIVMQNYWGSSDGIFYYNEESQPKIYMSASSPYYKYMAAWLKENKPGAEILINAVWSNEKGYNETPSRIAAANSSSFAGRDNQVQRYCYDQMEKFNGQASIDAGVSSGACGNCLRQLPVGYAVQLAREYIDINGNHPFLTLYNDSLNFANIDDGDLCPVSEEDAQAGNLRLNRDGSHLSLAGRYLAGLVWTEVLTGIDAEKCDFIPSAEILNCGFYTESGILEKVKVSFKPLSNGHILLLKKIAHQAVRNFYIYGVRGLDRESIPYIFDF